MSRQSFAILPKILEVDQALTPDLAWQEWVMEVHPEVCFWALNHHEPMRHNKKKPEGAEERTRLLRRVFETDFAPIKAPRGAAQDDLLDACAAAWTAARFARQEHGTLPESPPRDGKGLLMRIVY